MRVKLVSTLICLALFCPGCGSPPPRRGEGEIGAAPGENGQPVQFRVEMVASNLEVPWAIAFTSDGRVFVTERPGRVRVIEQGRLRPEPVATIREVASAEESGLMDLTLHPQFESNHYLYLAYAHPGGALPRGDANAVRPRRQALHHDGRRDPTGVGAAAGFTCRQDAAPRRRRRRPTGQPLRRAAERAPRDLVLRPSQRAGRRLAARYGRAVPDRAWAFGLRRPTRRRRSQRRRARQELRLAGDSSYRNERGHGRAVARIHSCGRPRERALLSRRGVPAISRRFLLRQSEGRAHNPRKARRPARCTSGVIIARPVWAHPRNGRRA